MFRPATVHASPAKEFLSQLDFTKFTKLKPHHRPARTSMHVKLRAFKDRAVVLRDMGRVEGS